MKKSLFVAIAALLIAFTSVTAEARGYHGRRHYHRPHGYVRYQGGFTRNHGSYYAPNGAYIGSHPRSIYRYKMAHSRMYHNRGWQPRHHHRAYYRRGPRRW